MSLRRAVVLSIDRLGAAWLGPYGNTWVETPSFNRQAAQSLVCETFIADSPHLGTVCRSWWTGRHAMQPDRDDQLLPAIAQAPGGQSVLITNDPAVAETSLAASFSRRIVRPAPDMSVCATEIEETG